MQQSLIGLILPLILIAVCLLTLKKLWWKKLKEYHSIHVGKIEIMKKSNGELVLTTDSFPQGLSIHNQDINKSYWYKIAELSLEICRHRKNPRILTFGLGANTTTGLINQQNPQIKQTIVEIEKEVIKAAQEFFETDKIKDLQIINADAYQLIKKNKPFPQQFDCIIVDIYFNRPPYLSSESNSPKFIQRISQFLKPNGRLIFNRPAHLQRLRDESTEIQKFLRTLFRETKIYDIKDPRGYRNHVITATNKK